MKRKVNEGVKKQKIAIHHLRRVFRRCCPCTDRVYELTVKERDRIFTPKTEPFLSISNRDRIVPAAGIDTCEQHLSVSLTWCPLFTKQ